VPTIGGAPRLFLAPGIEAAWSPDGSQIAYFFPPADPIFIADKNGGNPRQILTDKKGFHNHYLNWSPDGRFVYFVRGIPPDDMDVWRIRPAGGEPERVTNHHSRVAYPALLDARTLIYSALREDGGSGLYALDVERRIPHAVTSGLEEYTSVAASADGRRLVASVANPVRNLWTAPISDHTVDEESGVKRFDLPTVRAAAPRYGPGYVLYRSSRGGADGLWKLKDGAETELWKGSDGAVPFAPAVSPDGTQIAFVVHTQGGRRLTLMASDGTNAHRIVESLDVADVPSWSPDGKWIAVVVSEEEKKARPLLKVPVDGGPPVRLVDGVNSDPVWSPDGRLILYSEGRGGSVDLRAVTPDKQAITLPEIQVPYAGNRYRFMPGGKAVVILTSRVGQAELRVEHALPPSQPGEYWLLDLTTGRTRQLTNLRSGFVMKSFDVSPDGKQILFDRYRENSDVVLIDLPPR
jgi:Tol biopolymer transport system component